MGLDKWLKPEGNVNKKGREKKEKENILKTVSKSQKEKKDINVQELSADNSTKKLSKFELICSNRKCRYRKTFMKKLLTENDKTCPRCSSVMKVQKLN